MDKPKRWHLIVIITVLLLTVYNILPTIFYYAQPLSTPVGDAQARTIAVDMVERVNALEPSSKDWLVAFAKNLGLKPSSIKSNPVNPQLIDLLFSSAKDAERFRQFLPKAGARIPFVPAQLDLSPRLPSDSERKVTVRRHIGLHIVPESIDDFYTFSTTHDQKGAITPLYRKIIYDRVTELALGFAGPSITASRVNTALEGRSVSAGETALTSLAKDIVEYANLFGVESPITQRFYATFTRGTQETDAIDHLHTKLQEFHDKTESKEDALLTEQERLKKEGRFLESSQRQELHHLERQKRLLLSAHTILSEQNLLFKQSKPPLSKTSATAALAHVEKDDPSQEWQKLGLGDRNPFVNELVIDWANGNVSILLHEDVEKTREGELAGKQIDKYVQEKLNRLLINEMAKVSQFASEKIDPDGDNFTIILNSMTGTESFLTLDLGAMALNRVTMLRERLQQAWKPEHPDFAREVFPIWDYNTYRELPADEQGLGLIVYAPASLDGTPQEGFRTNSIYVIARGLQNILQKEEAYPDSNEGQLFIQDFSNLHDLLDQEGFFGYPAARYALPPEYKKDYIFEVNGYYNNYLKATRENFTVRGSKRYAVLEFSDLQQRIAANNKLRRQKHEDLLKWRDEYNAAQVSQNAAEKYLVSAPTTNIWWQNFKLNFYQFFHGDERKVLGWGLDLAGGKSVRIALKDQNGKLVSNVSDLTEGVNELYTRVNKMGLSEVNIRIEGETISLDFPGSQGLSAAELVTASSMTFHLVNEKFSSSNTALADTVNGFLQEVWNEAVVTNRTGTADVNEIAWRHLGGETGEEQGGMPRSEHAKILAENNLILAGPNEGNITSAFDDTISAIARWRGDDTSQWRGSSHPLVFIFRNYALEGVNLENVHTAYNPSRGNVLVFGVRSSFSRKSGEGHTGNPRDFFYNWTAPYSEERIVGTPKEIYSNGRGWRMAVILNDTMVSAPTLTQPLRASAEVSGIRSQREVNQLAADLKAGSLSFTPQILAERNISPELGQEQRSKAISAFVLGILLVVATMVWYYRFAGIIASIAVLFNLLIMWGVLQNMDASLTLAGIAGIILTVGMAVDANVLVFERIREEFAISKRLSSAIQMGYRKAFGAIMDSNLTTLIAAIILMQFDSGPIKGFAVTLVIGIVSSMFTALFMTRYFFSVWVRTRKGKTLAMRSFLEKPSIQFLNKAKPAMMTSLLLIVVGSYLLVGQRETMMGMDFTGGYTLNIELQTEAGQNYREKVSQALLAAGTDVGDFEVRELNKPNMLNIHFGTVMDQTNKPFYGMMQENPDTPITYDYQKNPRLTWVVDSLQTSGLHLRQDTLPNLDHNWSTMSGQFSSTMRNNALWALGLALICILIYISLRFEFKYAISAVICVAHNALISLGILAMFHAVGFSVQLNLDIIGAVMTIIGYSLNDIIVIFDRIREDVRLYKKLEFSALVNQALNKTLSRTLITSLTTALVLLSLVLLGGSMIFAFALTMLIGVVFGTLSSLYIASPVMLFFHNKEKKNASQPTTMKLKKA